MLRSLSTAVSGLRNHQTKLDVVGNNIANVNTVAFKYGVARFQDIFSQTLRGATAPLGGTGGINPMQVGLGMGISSIATVHEKGAITSTGRETDLAINGQGFFVVTDGYQNYYTRDGSFTRDATGVLVNANGLKLLGWVGEETDTSQPLGEICIPIGESMIASATENMVFTGNLNAGAAVGGTYTYPTYVYDSLGNMHYITFVFKKTNANEWSCSFYKGAGTIDPTNPPTIISIGTLKFTPEGVFTLDHDGDGKPDTPPIQYTLSLAETDLGTGAKDLAITLDFTALTQLASDESNVVLKGQDGFAAGELATFNIESTGIITGTYTNGMVRQIAQIAMASFINPEGLLKMGSNLYTVSSNSGEARIGLPGADGRGEIQSRSLEMSNVDLANEFTELITTSRGFQANTRVISTSDEVLLELINIKR